VHSGTQIWRKPDFQASGAQAIATVGNRVVAFGKLNQESAQKSIHVFNLATGDLICTIKETEEPVALQLTEHGTKVVTVRHAYFKPLALTIYDADSGQVKGAQTVSCDDIQQSWHLDP
jgi:hypothetical protein